MALESRLLLAVAPTSTVLAASAPTIVYGANLTLTATVSDTEDANTPTGGTVTFKQGTNTLATATLLNGTATFTTNSLPVGIDTFTASYSGTSVFGPSSMFLSPASLIRTYAGTGAAAYTGDGGLATVATLNNPTGLAVDGSGNLFISDQGNHVIRKVTADGKIRTVVGTGTAGNSGDGGLATDAEIDAPFGLTFDPAGNLFFVDRNRNVVREVTTDGRIHTIAGTGAVGHGGDGGPATAATFSTPEGLARDAAGNLYIVEQFNNDIRKVTTDGVIQTVVGTTAVGNTGDGGPATLATLNSPSNVTVDSSGNLFIVDQHNARIRKVSSAGIITAFAGTGIPGYSGDGGPATAATIGGNPEAIIVDAAGNVYFADFSNNVIREVTTDGIIHTVVGNGGQGYSGDGGQARDATLRNPYGVTVNSSGDLFIADDFNNAVREVRYSVSVTVTAPPPTLTAGGGTPSKARPGGAAVAVDPRISLVDQFGPNLTSTSISIDANFTAAEDLLLFTAQNGITGNYNTSTGILTLEGSATPAQYQAALRTVEYQNTNTASSANDTPRTISFSIAPGALNSASGHFYRFVSSPGITWTDAKAAADASSIYGLQGYLATITSDAENTFAFAKTQTSGWIGGSDPLNDDVWQWSDGPEDGQDFWVGRANGSAVSGAYTNWAPTQPDHGGGTEAFAQLTPTGQWNDLENNYGPIQGYLIEYGGSVGDPTLQLTSNATVNVVSITDSPTVTNPVASSSVNAASYTLTGTAEAGSLVKIYKDVNHDGVVDLGETVVGTAQLDVGQTSYSIPVALTQSSPNYFLVTATSSPIRESIPTVVPTLTADSTPPSFPTVTGPTAPISLNAPTVTITGMAEANSLVKIYAGDVIVASVQLTGGATSYSIAAPLAPDAVNRFAVTATDAAGNASASTAVPAVTEDSSPPAAPGSTGPSSPTSVNAAATAISGTAEAGSLVKIYGDANGNGMTDDGEAVVGMLQLAPGQTSYSISVPLTRNAPNHFLATATDAAGNRSIPAVVPTITEDSIPPAIPTVIIPGAASYVRSGAATITGTAPANSLVRIHKDFDGNGVIDIGDFVVGTLQLTGGATTYSITVPLDQNSSNDFLATATDAAGNPSSPAIVPTIIEDSTTPPAPRVTSPAGPLAVGTPTAPITGVALANSLVLIFEDFNNNGGIDAGDLVVASEQLSGGASNFSIPTPLGLNADNHFLVTATNAAGTRSSPAIVPTITTAAMVRGTVYLDFNASGSRQAVEPGMAGRVVFLDLDEDGVLGPGDPTATTDAGGNFSFPGFVEGSAAVLEANAQDVSDRHVVDQTVLNSDGTVNIGVVPISPVAPVKVVPNPFSAAPSPDANTAYVRSLYRAVLGRDGADFEVATWLVRMDSGMTRHEVAFHFVNSLEHRQSQVRAYYEEFLHREPEPGSAIWVDALLSGTSEERVVEAILDSPEYQAAHADPALFVRDLYFDVLGRQGEAAGVAGWEARLASGASRQAVVAAFVESAEAIDQIVQSDYTAFLHRRREGGTTSDIWVGTLEAAGGSATDVAAGILASPEFLEEATTPHA